MLLGVLLKRTFCFRSFRKRPFAITFSLDSKVLVADKSGLVHMISLSKDCQSAEEETEDSDEDDSCLGHYSTIIAMTMSVDGQYVITGDRDNKIRVSRYPNVWEIQSFCLSDPHFFVTRIWTLELEREWLFSVHHNGELKVWDGNSGIVKLRLSHSSVDCFLVDASAYVYDKHTVLVASISYSSNHCWICILKYDSLRDEFHCHKEFKLELVDIPCCVEFDKLGTLWFSFWKQHIDKVAIHHDKQLLWESNNNNYNNTSSNNHKMTWNTFRLDTNSTMAKHLLWNRPSMLHELRKKEYVADWKGKKKPRTDNFKYPQ